MQITNDECRMTKRAGLTDAQIAGLLAARESAAKERTERREEAEENLCAPCAPSRPFSPLARWFLAMCALALLGIVALAMLGSAAPDAVVIIPVAAGITGTVLGLIGYLRGGAL